MMVLSLSRLVPLDCAAYACMICSDRLPSRDDDVSFSFELDKNRRRVIVHDPVFLGDCLLQGESILHLFELSLASTGCFAEVYIHED